MTTDHDLPRAGLLPRCAAMIYESLLLVAVLFIAAFAFVSFARDTGAPAMRHAFQLYLALVMGLYFTWFWRRGQTLAMKTWRIRVAAEDGQPAGRLQVWLRYVMALAGFFALGAGFLWCFIDPERQFLHDRLARTRLLRLPAANAAARDAA